MAMGLNSGSGARTLAEINVTPMVDVMLVLLIIFMVAAPLMQQGVTVQLPEARAQPIDSDQRRSVLTLTAEHKIYLGEVEIPYAELRDRLIGNVKLREEHEIYLHADRALAYGFVVDIMAIIKDAGVQSLGMVTDPMSKRADAPRGR